MPSLARPTTTASRAGVRLFAGLILTSAAAVLSIPAAAAAGAHRPVVDAVYPVTASTAGDAVTLTGRGFTGTRSVSLLSPPGASVTLRPESAHFTVVSDDTLRLTLPAHEAGIVWIKVTNAAGSSAYSEADQVQYTPSSPAAAAAAAPGKDVVGALLLAMVLGMIRGRSKESS